MLSSLFKKEAHPVYQAAETDEMRADEADVEIPEKGSTRKGIVSVCKQMFSLHWFTHLLFLITILVLSFRLDVVKPTGNFLSTRTPIPVFPEREVQFMLNKSYAHEFMFESGDEIRAIAYRWSALQSESLGMMTVLNAADFTDVPAYDNAEPFPGAPPFYITTSFHQLHCLQNLMSAFAIAYMQNPSPKQDTGHIAHCFDYLRQTIQCAADPFVEGASPIAGPGWGGKRVCRDMDAMKHWQTKHFGPVFKPFIPDAPTSFERK